MDDAEIRLRADRVLRSRLSGFKFERAEVRSGLDHSDQPAIYIEAILGEDAPAFQGSEFFDAHAALSADLLANGESRFPYFRTRRLDGDFPEDVMLRPRRDR